MAEFVAATWNVQGNGLVIKKKDIGEALDTGLIDIFCFQEVGQAFVATKDQLKIYAVEHKDAQIIHPTTGATSGRGYCVMYKRSRFDEFSADYMLPFQIKPDSNAEDLRTVHAPLVYTLRLDKSLNVRLLNYHAPNGTLKTQGGDSLLAAMNALKVVKIRDEKNLDAAAKEDSENPWFLIGDLNVSTDTLANIFTNEKYWARSRDTSRGTGTTLDHMVGLYRAKAKEKPTILAVSQKLREKLKPLKSDHYARGFTVSL